MTTINFGSGAGWGTALHNVSSDEIDFAVDLLGHMTPAEHAAVEDSVGDDLHIVQVVADLLADRAGVADDDYDRLGDIENKVWEEWLLTL